MALHHLESIVDVLTDPYILLGAACTTACGVASIVPGIKAYQYIVSGDYASATVMGAVSVFAGLATVALGRMTYDEL